MKYETVTVGNLIKVLQEVQKKYGKDIPVYSGDFEGNYLHGKHEVCFYSDIKAVCLQYEMHESIEEF